MKPEKKATTKDTNTATDSLSHFHPLIQQWFVEKFGSPTDIQIKAWPVISKGENVLVCAPTGTGKTLTAFLWAINQLIRGRWEEGTVHVLYISPLKALNNDIRENLLEPLKEIRHLFSEKNEQFPSVRIITRSGDTPQSERRAMVSRPPSILITTPESLNLIITSPRARNILKNLKTVILDALVMLLDKMHTGAIKISNIETHGSSPFSGSLVWKYTNQYLYEDDTPYSISSGSRLSEELLNEIAFSSTLRPAFQMSDITLLQEKLHRTADGYAPSNAIELVEWVSERMCLPMDEWDALIASMIGSKGTKGDQDNQTDKAAVLSDPVISEKLRIIQFPGAQNSCVTSRTIVPILARIFDICIESLGVKNIDGSRVRTEKILISDTDQSTVDNRVDSGFLDLSGHIAHWLSFYGPINPSMLTDVFGLEKPVIDSIIIQLSEQIRVIPDIVVINEHTPYFCDAENCERLLRSIRKKSRQQFTALPIALLPFFIATIQGTTKKETGIDGLKRVLERLLHFPMKAAHIESEIIKTRIDNYTPHLLDSLISTSELEWFGSGKEYIAFRFSEDRAISGNYNDQKTKVPDFLTDNYARYSYLTLMQKSKQDTTTFSNTFWNAVWSGTLSSDTYESIRKGVMAKFGKKSSSKTLSTTVQRRMGRQMFKPVGFDR